MHTKLSAIINKLIGNHYLLAAYGVLLFLVDLLFTFLGGLDVKSSFSVISYSLSVFVIL